MTLRGGPALFVQPHYDDVALSCGATAAAFARAGHPASIVTVFASDILDAMVGDFAAWKHARWKLEDADAVQAARRAEDAASAAALGLPVRWLGLPDAIYRGERYTSDDELYGGLHPEEVALAAHLAEEIIHLPEWQHGTQVFVPLAVGSHADHLLVFEAGRVLAARGVAVYAYEDCPYAIHTPLGLASRLAEVDGQVGGVIAHPIPEATDAKLDAVACYASQLPVLFRFTADWRAALRGHMRSVGEGAEAERFWRVLGES